MGNKKPLHRSISDLDREILSLILERATAVRGRGEVEHFSLAEDVVAEIARLTGGRITRERLVHLVGDIASITGASIKPRSIAFLGPQGTFTHEAALCYFGEHEGLVEASTVEDVFFKVIVGEATLGVVPVENSTEGMVNDTYDMLVSDQVHTSQVKICGEKYLPIHQNILAKQPIEAKDIKKIISHPQALRQCTKWISDNAPGAQRCPVDSTAKAAQEIRDSREENVVAIGSEAAARIYRLQAIYRQVEDLKNNTTRFVIIGRFVSPRVAENKTTIAFALEDRIATLRDALTTFELHKINMRSLRTRPLKMEQWERRKDWFFADLEAHIEDKNMDLAYKRLEQDCLAVRFLGSYPSEKDPREVPKT
jgi:chorismate mutase/prephenate dehydratase